MQPVAYPAAEAVVPRCYYYGPILAAPETRRCADSSEPQCSVLCTANFQAIEAPCSPLAKDKERTSTYSAGSTTSTPSTSVGRENSSRSLSEEQATERKVQRRPNAGHRGRKASFGNVEVKICEPDSAPTSPATLATSFGLYAQSGLSPLLKKTEESTDSTSDDERTPPVVEDQLNRWFSSVEKRRSKRSATANVGANIEGGLPTPTNSRLWNRRLAKGTSIESDSSPDRNEPTVHSQEVEAVEASMLPDQWSYVEPHPSGAGWGDSIFCCLSRNCGGAMRTTVH